MVLGVVGVVVVHFCDLVAIRRLPVVKPFTWLLGGGLIVYVMVGASGWKHKLPLPAWSTAIGWALLAISALLVAYALFVNLPFYKTYVARGFSERLITTGFYALTRHPGVLWTVLLIVSLVLVSKSVLVLATAPLFIFLDILMVTIQDRFYFGRMFAGYDRYRRDTPMLIPTSKSIRTFVASLRRISPPRRAEGANNDLELS